MTLALGAAVILPIVFVVYTGEIWEDFFITYRFSENLANGRGLVYSDGERVHGFTSVINTLLPAFVCWITRSDFQIPLLVYRIFSLSALLIGVISIAGLMANEKAETPRNRAWIALLFPLFVALEIKITAFAMNGQEAGFMLGFLAPALALAYLGWTRHWLLGGLCFAGLMYTRPDGFVFIGAIAVGAFVFGGEPRREIVGALLRSFVVVVVLYLPWMIFAWSYYGSPIPHTILAKQGTIAPPVSGFSFLAPVGAAFALLPERMCGALTGVYDFFDINGPGAWPKWVRDVGFVFEALAVTYWLIPTRDRLGRLASFVAMIVLAYLTYASVLAYSCPWYYPPLSFVSLLALVRMSMTLPGYLPNPRRAAGVAVLAVAGLLLFLGFIFTGSLRSLRLKQEVVDWGHRRVIGEWLRANVSDSETVYLECLGYIGYFSQRKMRDWPGLVSPEVVQARKKIGRPAYPWGAYVWGKVAEEIQPDWMVARPVEAEQIKHSPTLSSTYRLVKVFNATEPIIAAGEFYGSAITYNDAVFLIYRRNAPPTSVGR
jgi:hypothetical protein